MTYDPKTLTVGSLLDGYYSIPRFQRPFNWTEAQVEDLMLDIFASPKQTAEDGYFLGSIVTIRRDPSTSTLDDPYILIDGQQRLTTLSLVLLMLLPLVEAERTGDAESRQDRVVRARARLRERRQEAHSGGWINTAKLRLQPKDADVFERLINDPAAVDHEDLAAHRIILAAKAIRQQIEQLHISSFSGDLSFASAMMDMLCDRVSLVRINADSESAGFRLFEAMNDRGLDLSAADLIKNKLLARCRDADSDAVLKDWQQVLDKVGSDDIIGFLRTYWIATNGFVRKNKLYDAYKTKLSKESASEIRQFSRDLVRGADFYSTMEKPNLGRRKSKDRELAGILMRLKYYNAKSFRPAFLAAQLFRGSDAAFLIRVARLCESITVRWSVVAKKNANALEGMYSALAKRIRESSGEISELIPAEELAGVPDDKALESGFVGADTSAIKQWFAVLEALNRRIDDDDVELNLWATTGIHVEHIMPQQPSDEVIPLYGCTSQSEVERWCGSVGNLTLLGGRRNRRISNGAYSGKRDVLAGSGVRMTREIGERFHRWTPAEIEKRAKEMAKLAVAVFSLSHNRS